MRIEVRAGALILMFAAVMLAGCSQREEPSAYDTRSETSATPKQPSDKMVVRPIDRSAASVKWTQPAFPREVPAGGTVPVSVTFTNTSGVAWPNSQDVDGQPSIASAVRLNYSWTRSDEKETNRKNGERLNLPQSVQPGETLTVPVAIRVPTEPGQYSLVIELLQELVFWFGDAGADKLVIPVRVLPGGGTATGK